LALTLGVAGAAAAQEKPGTGAAKKPAAQAKPSAPKQGADDAAKRDLAMLQGTWEHEVRDRQGKVVGRMVKYIQGNKEMVIHERADGKVVHAHRVDFEPLRAHGFRVFRYGNAEILEGPNKGQKMNPGAYVYRVTEEAFTEVNGFMVGQEEQAISARVYKRVKDQPEPREPRDPAEPEEPAQKDEP
jgi:hypothetical protein